MRIGHINLARSFNGAGEHFVKLIEALQKEGVQQHVLVRSVDLATQLELIDGVTVGPTVRSAIMAYCLMPAVDVVHIHDPADGQAGLLLALTRSIPFVLTCRGQSPGSNPVSKAVFRRAAGSVFLGDADVKKHLRLYRRVLSKWGTQTLSV